MRKILALIWKELYTTYTDRNLLIIMIATPFALATIIGLAFGNFFSGSNDVPIQDIPVAIVNQDQGVEVLGNTVNNGDIVVDLLVPPSDESDEVEASNTSEGSPLFDLTNAVLFDEPAAARADVDSGDYVAAIIIPPDFTQFVTFTPTHQQLGQTSIEVYASQADPISANVIRSIVDAIANRIATGSITVAATLGALIDQISTNPLLGLQMLVGFRPDFTAAYNPELTPIAIEQQTVTGEAATFNPIVYFGAAQAIFFMMFTAQGGALSLLEERRDGTLQRLLVSPTPRIVILLGKLTGTLVNCIVQLLLLFVFLSLVSSLLSGQFELIWGNNIPAIALVIVSAALAASGLGILLSAFVRSPESGNGIGGLIIILMGVLGGSFFSTQGVPVLETLSRLTINYWGIDAFTKLAQGQTDIGLNVLVLAGIGSVMFVAGLFLFNRRLSV